MQREVMQRKRHSPNEIVAKLEQADELARQGRRRVEIARALGVSLMTYHRWRKAHEQTNVPHLTHDVLETAGDRTMTISDLEQENIRLRRLVTDLLLKKLELEEQLHERRFRRSTA